MIAYLHASPQTNLKNLRSGIVWTFKIAGSPHPLLLLQARTEMLYSVHGERSSHEACVFVCPTEQLKLAPRELLAGASYLSILGWPVQVTEGGVQMKATASLLQIILC